MTALHASVELSSYGAHSTSVRKPNFVFRRKCVGSATLLETTVSVSRRYTLAFSSARTPGRDQHFAHVS